MNYIVFDIETYWPDDVQNTGKIDTKIMKPSVMGAYYSWLGNQGKYIAFLETEVMDFIESLFAADLIVGYNHLWFDLPVLQKYSSQDLQKLPNFDLLKEVEKELGFKSKLDTLAKATLGTAKTDSYEHYRHYHKQGKWMELIDYCMNDVKITNDLFKRVLNNQAILYSDNLQTRELFIQKPSINRDEDLLQATTIF